MVLSMGKADEQRTEHRLQYRWPVRFFIDGGNQSFNGQLVDISSKGMSFLCHADQSNFDSGQKIKASFGVPHFGLADSFDTVLFEREGNVHRIDKPSSRIYRIAMQFSSPLFFKPGEQGINQLDIEQRLDEKNFSVIKAEETARAYNEALTQAEKQLRNYAQAKAKIEEQLKVEIEDRARYETQLRIETEDKIRSYTEEIARLETKLKAKEKEIEKLTQTMETYREKVESLEEQFRKLNEQKYLEINSTKEEANKIISEIKSKYNNNSPQSEKNDLLKKFDKFISDRNKIF